jgi:ubiquinone biosynthesis protein
LNIVSAVRDLGRLREISAVLVRHGFGEIVARAGFGRRVKASPVAPLALAEGDEGPASAEALAELKEERTKGEAEKQKN